VAKLPSWQFYPGDWRKDPAVQSLSYNDRGVWFEILCLMHESEQRGKLLLNGKKMPDDALARLLGLDKQILNRTLTTLLRFGVASLCPLTGALMNRRMIRDEEIRKIRTECGKRGGNPTLLNQNPDLLNQNPTSMDNQKSTPSSSSSSSLKKKEKDMVVYAPDFLSFWKIYPKKNKKKVAFLEWGKSNGKRPPIEILIEVLEKQISTKEKLKKTGEFCPEWQDPERWIKNARWEDEVEVKKGKWD
jgi:hypothetical protein